MPKRLAFFAGSFLFLCTLISPAHALFENEVDKAKDFIKAGMFPQAIEQLNKRITDKPTDAEAHYLLGTCYMNTGDYGAAEERFKSAVRLKADYGYQIGGEFKKAGSAALNKGQVQQAQGLFAKAVEYQPNLKREVALECLAAGKTYLRRGQTDIADGLFAMAVGNDGSLNSEVNQTRTDYGMRLLETAKTKPKEERKKYIEEAKKYVDQKTVDEAFPPPTLKIVFEKTYTYDDAFSKEGGIKAIEFGVDDVKIGDTVEVVATLLNGEKFSGQEIGVFRSNELNPPWDTTRQGYYRQKIEMFEPGKFYLISTGGRRDVKITVKATRLVASY